MRKTLTLLEMLTKEYPPPEGHKHQVCLHDGKLQICLVRETSTLTIRLEDSDLSTPVDYLFHDIKGLVSKQSIPPMHYSIPVPRMPSVPPSNVPTPRCKQCGWMTNPTEGVIGSTAYRCANVGCGVLMFERDVDVSNPGPTH